MVYGRELERFLTGAGNESALRAREAEARASAQKYTADNIVSEPALALQIIEEGYSFSEFQELGLYSPQGFFEKTVDFSVGSMPLIPQVLSPFFGKCISELTMLLYLNDPNRVPNPTFMGIGAGRGYLDYDLIDHFMTVAMNPEWRSEVKKLREASQFLVTDRTEKSQHLLIDELTEIRQAHQLGDRMKIMKLDVTDFGLKQEPYGVVYGNEILDNMPVEPIIKVDGNLYGVVVLPYSEGVLISDDKDSYKRALGDRFEELKNKALKKEEAQGLIEGGASRLVKFKPVLIPLELLPKLNEAVQNSQSAKTGLENPEFEGLYPYQAGLPLMLRNIRRSFSHGLVLLIDLSLNHNNTHDWERTIGSVSNFSLENPKDLDFQVDFEQVKEEGEKEGMEVAYFSPQSETIKTFSPLLNTLTLRDMRRWAKANQLGNLSDRELPTAIRNGYAIYFPFTNFHNIIALSF